MLLLSPSSERLLLHTCDGNGPTKEDGGEIDTPSSGAGDSAGECECVQNQILENTKSV